MNRSRQIVASVAENHFSRAIWAKKNFGEVDRKMSVEVQVISCFSLILVATSSKIAVSKAESLFQMLFEDGHTSLRMLLISQRKKTRICFLTKSS